MARRRSGCPPTPRPGGADFQVVVLGPPIDDPIPPEVEDRPHSNVPLVPTADEIAKLPRLAQEAFAARCALRVEPVRPSGVASAADAARVIFETATIDTPLTAQLRCIRRDFNRLKRLAREQKWTDDTPVPPEVFGPLWPRGVEPHWAAEAPKA